MRIWKNLATCALVVLFASLVSGQDQKSSSALPADGIERLGTVNFAVSCAAPVQPFFSRAVALLHSFQYEIAEKAFADVARNDPQCAMAYWGQALSLYHPLWDWPEAATLKQGHTYMEKAQELGAKKESERGYIHAAAVFYQDAPDMTVASRAVAYSKALGELHQRYPEDHNAAAFYALSLIAMPAQTDAEETKNRTQAIEILNQLFRQEPDHPGVAHYLIHATDTPKLAHLGLDAARRYAGIAPDSPHALHMPSHIFTELGLWQESIQSNLASAAAAERITKSQSANDSDDQMHALSFLEYSYLQTGHAADARRVIERIKNLPGASPQDIAENDLMFREMYIEETHQWKDAGNLMLSPDSYAMERVMAYKTRAIGAARSGDVAKARADIQNLQKAYDEMLARMKAMGGSPPSGESASQLEAEAWLAYTSGKQDEAVTKMKAAVDRGGRSTRMAGVPGIPVSEMLGDLLLELHRPAEALAAYESSLKDAPNRFNSLYGAARSAQLAGNSVAAKRYDAELKQVCGAGADRIELRQ
jgi:tetratricopeptide (TPR) repeat protein